MDLAAIIAMLPQLLSAGTEIANLIQTIKTQSPDAWAQVSTDYADSLAAWKASVAQHAGV